MPHKFSSLDEHNHFLRMRSNFRLYYNFLKNDNDKKSYLIHLFVPVFFVHYQHTLYMLTNTLCMRFQTFFTKVFLEISVHTPTHPTNTQPYSFTPQATTSLNQEPLVNKITF